MDPEEVAEYYHYSLGVMDTLDVIEEELASCAEAKKREGKPEALTLGEIWPVLEEILRAVREARQVYGVAKARLGSSSVYYDKIDGISVVELRGMWAIDRKLAEVRRELEGKGRGDGAGIPAGAPATGQVIPAAGTTPAAGEETKDKPGETATG